MRKTQVKNAKNSSAFRYSEIWNDTFDTVEKISLNTRRYFKKSLPSTAAVVNDFPQPDC